MLGKALRLSEVWKCACWVKPKPLKKGAFHLATRHAEQAVKARGMAQQVAFGERDDAFAGRPPLAVARTPLALTSSGNLERNRYIRLFDVWHRHAQRRSQTETIANRYTGMS